MCKKLKVLLVAVCSILLYYSLPVYGDDVPARLSFQGRLADSNGDPITATGDIVFKIYDETEGSVLWTETQTGVTISNGIFNVNLGDVAPIPAGLFPGATRYLEIGYGGETLSPKIMLVSNGYAFCADTLDGKEYAHFVTTATVQTIEGVKTFTDDIQFASMTISGQITLADGTVMTSTTAFSGGGSEWNDTGTVLQTGDAEDDIQIMGNDILDSGGNTQITFTEASTTTFSYAINASSFIIKAGGKLYIGDNTDQYIYAFGENDLTFMDESANWMRFSNNGGEFHWFNDGPAMSETRMLLTSDGDLTIDGDIRVDGNEIKNSDGEATITMDADQNIVTASSVTVGRTLYLTNLGFAGVQSYPRTPSVGIIQQCEDSDDNYKRYLNIVSAGNDRSSVIRFLNQVGPAGENLNDPTESMRIDITGYVGIGAPSPAEKLDVVDGNIKTNYGVITATAVFTPGSEPAAAEGMIYYDSTDGQLKLYDNSDGWVQIGTGTVVAGGGGSDNLGNHTATQDLQMAGFDIINVGSITIGSPTPEGALHVVSDNTIPYTFSSSNTVAGYSMVISTSGRVGVGATNMDALLHIRSDGNQLILEDTNSTADENKWLMKADSDKFYFLTANDAFSSWGEAMIIGRSGVVVTTVTFPSGNVGIGTVSPATKFDVTGGSICFGNAGRAIEDDAANGAIKFSSNVIISGNLNLNTQSLHDAAIIDRSVTNSNLRLFGGSTNENGGGIELYGITEEGDEGRVRILVPRQGVGFDIMRATDWDTILTLDTSGNMVLDGNMKSYGVNTTTAVFVPGSAPEAAEGMVYYDSTSGQLKLYDNSDGWVQIGTGTVVAGGGGSDDLGNHIATQDLNMTNFNIISISSAVIQSSATVQGPGGLEVNYGIKAATITTTDDLTVEGNDIFGSEPANSITFSTIGDTVTLSGALKFHTTFYKSNGDLAMQFETSNTHFYTDENGWFTFRRTTDGQERFKIDSTGDIYVIGNTIMDSGSGAAISFDGSQNTAIEGEFRLNGNIIKDSGGTTRVDISEGVVFSTAVRVGNMTNADAPAGAEGMLYYDTDSDQLKLYDSSGWVQIGTGTVIAGGGGSDDLGNHIATQDLNMTNFNIISISSAVIQSSATVQGPGGLEVDYGITAATATFGEVRISTLNMNSSYIENITELKNITDTNLDIRLLGTGSLHIANSETDGSAVYIGQSGDVDLEVSGMTQSSSFTVVNQGKVYLNDTDQYIYAYGGSDMAFIDESSNWMRFSNNNSEFHWFSDGTAMADSRMILQADGDLEIDGDIRVDGNDIMNVDGETTIAMDADQNVTLSSNVTVGVSLLLSNLGFEAVQTYSRTTSKGIIQQYQNSNEDYRRYLDIVTSGNDRPATIRFLNQKGNDTDPTESLRIDTSGNLCSVGDISAGWGTVTASTMTASGDLDLAGDIKAGGYMQLGSKTIAELEAMTPTAVGQVYYVSDGANSVNMVISTGTGVCEWDSMGVGGTAWH